MNKIETLLASLTPEEAEWQERYDRKQALALKTFALLDSVEKVDYAAIVASACESTDFSCGCEVHSVNTPTPSGGMVTTLVWRTE